MEAKTTAIDYNAQLLCGNALRNVPDLDHSKIQGDKARMMGPIAVYETLLDCVDVLFSYTPSALDGFTSKEWNEYLARLYFGVIKESEVFGTTSVSQGVAQQDLDCYLPTLPPSSVMGFINCGTGGCKIQVAAIRLLPPNNTPIVHILFECKGTGLEPSINAMRVGNFVPENEISKEEQTKRYHACLQNLAQELASRGLFRKISLGVFITGNIRHYYENLKNEDEKQVMEDEVDDFFGTHDFGDDIDIAPWNGHSYFMTQEQEASMERKAAESLYGNLVQANLLDKNVIVVGAFGAGRGSSQLDTCLVPFGMNSPTELKANVPKEYLKALHEGLAKKMYLHSQKAPKNAKFVIALKSGFAMLLDNKQNDWLIQSIRNQSIDEKEPTMLSKTDNPMINSDNIEQNDDEEGDEGDYEDDEALSTNTDVNMHVSTTHDKHIQAEIQSLRMIAIDVLQRLAALERL